MLRRASPCVAAPTPPLPRPPQTAHCVAQTFFPALPCLLPCCPIKQSHSYINSKVMRGRREGRRPPPPCGGLPTKLPERRASGAATTESRKSSAPSCCEEAPQVGQNTKSNQQSRGSKLVKSEAKARESVGQTSGRGGAASAHRRRCWGSIGERGPKQRGS